jgi:hypothetical protein
MKLFALISVLVASLAGCGSSDSVSPREGCEDLAVALCDRLYTCFTAAELDAAGYPASEAACVTEFETTQGCAAQTEDNACEGNETFHGDEASNCIDQTQGLECSQVRSGDIDDAAPACDKVCAVD